MFSKNFKRYVLKKLTGKDFGTLLYALFLKRKNSIYFTSHFVFFAYQLDIEIRRFSSLSDWTKKKKDKEPRKKKETEV